MDKNYNTDDTFLARWISGELSEAERVAFEKTEAYKQFDIINKESQLLAGPDIDTEAALKLVTLKLQEQQKKPKIIRLWYVVAASIVILISLGTFLNSSKTHITGIGEKTHITLSDGSKVHLNANSSVSYKRFFWLGNKEVNLRGEAYFSVEKGDGFTVNTSKGHISVLGTQFNIKDRNELEVKCYEGKVSFIKSANASKTYILTSGMQVNVNDEHIYEGHFNHETPNWKDGISKFVNQPLSKVLEELTYIYPITFKTNSINTDRLFSGSFTHNNLNTALQTTLVPMGITYKKSPTSNVIILSE